MNYQIMTLSALMQIVKSDWKNPYFGAVPYIRALSTVNQVSLEGNYGCDDVRSIVVYFLSNAATWRGPVAREVKAELKRRLR